MCSLFQEEKAAELGVLQEQMEENERLLRESQKSWDEKLKEAQCAADERKLMLTRMGLAGNCMKNLRCRIMVALAKGLACRSGWFWQ